MNLGLNPRPPPELSDFDSLPRLEVIDGAKNPELVPEYMIWGRIRNLVMRPIHPKFPSPEKAKMQSILGAKISEIAKLASKYSKQIGESHEKYEKAFQGTLDSDKLRQLGIEASSAHEAIELRFKSNVLKLLNKQERTELQEFLLKDVAKEIWLGIFPKED